MFTSQLVPVARIGAGATSEVFEYRHPVLSRCVAVKLFSDSDDKTIDHERRMLSSLDSPFISHYYGQTQIQNSRAFVLEACEGSTLLNLVSAEHEVAPPRVQAILCQLVLALEYLHEVAHIIHRDVKLENIIVGPEDRAKLIDFGVARVATPATATFCGSLAYIAPEVMRGLPYTGAVDVWGLGVCLYAMVYGRLPFADENAKRLIDKVLYTEPAHPADDEAADLIARMLEKDPAKRATIAAIKEHPFVDKEVLAKYERMAGMEDVRLAVSRKEDVDMSVVEKMEEMGFRKEEVVEALVGRCDDEATMTYRSMRGEKVQAVLDRVGESKSLPNLARLALARPVMGKRRQTDVRNVIVKPQLADGSQKKTMSTARASWLLRARY